MSPLVRRWFWLVWHGRDATLWAIVLMTVVNAALITAFPWLWQYVIDAVRSGGAQGTGRLVVWMFVVGIVQSALYGVLQGTRTLMNSLIQHSSRMATFGHLTRVEGRFWDSWRVGDLVTRLTDDAGEKTSWFLCSGIFRALEAVLQMTACLMAMAWVDPILTVGVALPLPLLVVGQARAQSASAERFTAIQTALSTVNDQLTTAFGGIRIVQACGLEAGVHRRFVEAVERQRSAEISSARIQQAIFLMYGYGWQLAIVALLVVGGERVVGRDLSLGQFVAFEGFVMALVWPMFDVGTFVSRVRQADTALRRLQELLDQPARHAGTAIPADAAIDVHQADVSVGDATLLRGVELHLRPGEMVAAVGEVGSGKSTLLRLLVGAAAPSRGTVAVGGVPHGDALASSVRTQVAYVPQDPVLLSASLRDNITLGRAVTDAQIERALHVSRLAQDLPQLPAGLDTHVGERGVTLSGGQQQRVALARALVGSPSILVLDDATAALDAETEAAFWRELEAVLPDVLAVVVTHRVATIERAHRVVVLEKGEIVQTGRHAELVEQEGPYRRIYGRLSAALPASIVS